MVDLVDADFSFVVTTPVCSCQARNYRVDVLEVNASVLNVVWVVWKYSTRVFKNEHYSSLLQCFMSTRHVEVLRAALANHVRVTLSLVFRFFCVSRVL